MCLNSGINILLVSTKPSSEARNTMSKYLIVYGTKEGQTAKIADKIGEVIRQHGLQADIYDARKVPTAFQFDGYTGALIGSSIHMSQWSSPALQFVRRYKIQLDKVPSAFFSVSMTAASPTPEERAKLNPYVQKFFDKSGWHPETVGNLAGSLTYTKYGFFTRWLMHRIARSKGEGADTDTSHDIEFTDWEHVTRFADDFVNEAENKLAPAITE
jgi:menaquinone-dependent protoporphyrinogen oxidase